MSLRRQKILYGVTLLVSLMSLGCFFACIFSAEMVKGSVSNKDINAANFGNITVGLIWGTKQYNYGYGLRKAERFTVYNEHTSSTKGVTAAVLSFLCVACVFNVVGIFLSMENAFIIPVQTLQGPIGLYIWYSISGICAFISFLMYSILYPTQMRDNIDSDSEPDFTADVTHFGYAYWLLFTGTVLVGANVGLVHLARKSIEPNYFKNANGTSKAKIITKDTRSLNDGMY